MTADSLPAVETPPCPLCGGTDYRPLIASARDLLARKRGEFGVQACRGCGLVATRPRPTAQQLAYYYDQVYSGSASSMARALQTGPAGRAVARYRWRVARRFVPPGARLLDVGCGYGALLQQAQQAGHACSGLDMDAGSIAQALDRERIDYRVGTLEDAGFAPASFGAVALFESLEHHADPVQALRAVHGLLAPGGVCIVEVPNFASPWRRLFGRWWLPLLVPQHLFHFTPGTLRRTLEAAGFEVAAPARGMFYPTESTASLGLWLNERLGRPLRAYRTRAARPDGLLLLILLALWWVAIELPSQALLAAAGRSGHQLMVGRKAG